VQVIPIGVDIPITHIDFNKASRDNGAHDVSTPHVVTEDETAQTSSSWSELCSIPYRENHYNYQFRYLSPRPSESFHHTLNFSKLQRDIENHYDTSQPGWNRTQLKYLWTITEKRLDRECPFNRDVLLSAQH